jgi:EAL domain-containing protein (putative c-di-GMP-specific phosphodiesterase class I)
MTGGSEPLQLCCDDREHLLNQLARLRKGRLNAGLLSCRFRHYSHIEALHGQQQAERLVNLGRQRLQVLCPTDTAIWRPLPDELILLIPGSLSTSELEELAQRCAQGCGVAQQSGELPLLLHLAIGVVPAELMPTPDSAALLAVARLARHQAEQRPGRQVAMAHATTQQQAARNYQRESNLASSIEQHELIAHLQPIVNLADGQTIGFECLARWPQVDGSLINPQDFLAQAHNMGISADIDLQVLRYCLGAAAQLAAAAGPGRRLILSANISAPLLENPRKIEALLQLIANHPLPSTVQLQLELLEESLNNAACELDTLLEWLSEQQVLIAIDDFGTGYSSLSRLHDLAVNTIKVDRSFVARIDAPNKPSNHLLRSLVAISHDLQLSLTAEGIETEAQRQWLLGLGVEHGQGYLFSRPLSLADAIDHLSKNQGSAEGCPTS